jgi:predicted ATPase
VLASVLGREFALDTLALLAEAPPDRLLDTLDEALVARVVSEVPGHAAGRLRFAHVLIRDTLYAGLTVTRRVKLHRHATEALKVRHGDQEGSHLAELAHHSIAGSDFDNARRYATLAGAWEDLCGQGRRCTESCRRRLRADVRGPRGRAL